MCGIFGYVGYKHTAAQIVLEGLKRLEYRGYDSWGVADVPNDHEIAVKKKAGRIGEGNVDDLPKATLAFGHTRWATHGGVSDINAHPHLDCKHEIALIHNGIFENYESVKKDLLKKGHSFISETDTEVAVHLIEEYAKTMSFSKAVQKAFNHMEGLNAIIVVRAKDRQLIAARNGSPLVVGFGHDENFLASDATALLPHTKQVHYLGDNQMAIIGDKAIMLFNVVTGEHIHPTKQRLTWSAEEAEKGKYDYFMRKEIDEQPAMVADIAASYGSQAEKLAVRMQKSEHVYLVGCGSASYAATAGEYMFSKIAKKHANSAIGSEFGYHLDFLGKNSLVVAISQSGETMDILESVKKAHEKGATVAALVNVMGSSLYRMADVKMLIGAGPEKAVASTKALTGMLSHLLLAAYAHAGRTKQGSEALTLAVRSMKDVLSPDSVNRITKLAKRFKKEEHIYAIGRGLSYPTALETALKIKEISYIHAEGLAAGELKHGPLALVQKGTPVVAFLPDDETYGANLAGAMEMKARGGYIVGVSSKPHEVFDEYIAVRDAKEATILPNVVVAQLLAYYLTIERHLDPDMPRNLAKSVTVK